MQLKALFSLLFIPTLSFAEEKSVEVGKYVTPSTDSSTMILALLLVLGVVIACAYVLKKFQLTTQGSTPLKVVTSLHLGAKERVVVVQVGEKQMVLGVTANQISVLDTLDQPLDIGKNVNELFDKSFINTMKKNSKING